MRVITSENVAEFVHEGALQVGEGWTLAPSALEYLRRNRIRFAGEESRQAAAAASNLAVITVEGIDKPGIIAAVATEVANRHGNVTDLSQTILAGVFVMVMIVDLSGADGGYEALAEGLARVGQEIGMEISVRLYSVYEAMHRI